MKYFFTEYFTHKALYAISLTFGGLASCIIEKSLVIVNSTLFGISVLLWLMAFIVNMYDIYTGIKADTKKQENDGKKFVFKSYRGWRAVEKIFVFTFIIAFLQLSEKEALRLDFASVMFIMMVVKLSLFFYTILIEIQSIGENEEVRYGKKGKLYKYLDTLIEVVNEGILTRLKRVFSN